MDNGFFIILSMMMFTIGLIGVLTRRNILILFLCIEMMLNAANLLFVAFSRHWNHETGMVWVFFIFVVAATEAAIGLAMIIHFFRARGVLDVDQINDLKG